MFSNSYQLPLDRLGIDSLSLKDGVQIRAPREFIDEVAKQFVVARKEQGLTADEVCFRVGCADRLVQKWEIGLRMPSGLMMWCWAKALKKRIVIL